MKKILPITILTSSIYILSACSNYNSMTQSEIESTHSQSPDGNSSALTNNELTTNSSSNTSTNPQADNLTNASADTPIPISALPTPGMTTAELAFHAAIQSTPAKTRTFANVTHLNLTGFLQHIVVSPAAGDELVIRWSGDESEAITEQDGHVSFTTQEPDWMDKSIPGDGDNPRFTVTSTIYIEIPSSIDVLSLNSTLGDITINAAFPYNKLTANTVTGDIITSSLNGIISAETKEGRIGPDSFADEIVEAEYSLTQRSQTLATIIPGSDNKKKHTTLYTVTGSISINE